MADKRTYTTPQAGLYLKLSFPTIRALAKFGAIKSTTLGKRYVFTRDALDEFKQRFQEPLAAYVNRKKKVPEPKPRFVNYERAASYIESRGWRVAKSGIRPAAL